MDDLLQSVKDRYRTLKKREIWIVYFKDNVDCWTIDQVFYDKNMAEYHAGRRRKQFGEMIINRQEVYF